MNLDVKKKEVPVVRISKDEDGVHDTVVIANLARIRSAVNGSSFVIDHEAPFSVSNEVAISLRAEVVVDEVDDLIVFLQKLKAQRELERKQGLSFSSNLEIGAQELGLRIVISDVTFAHRVDHEQAQQDAAERMLSKLLVKNIETKEREDFLSSDSGHMLIKLCVQYKNLLEYVMVAPYLGMLKDLPTKDLPFAISFFDTDKALYIPHATQVHDYFTTLSCMEFEVKSPSPNQLRSIFRENDELMNVDLTAYAQKLANAIMDSRSVCSVLSKVLTDNASLLELKPIIWLDCEVLHTPRWDSAHADDAYAKVVAKIFIWQQPPVAISSVCHRQLVRSNVTFQQFADGNLGHGAAQLGELMNGGREMVYAFVEQALMVWTKSTATLHRKKEYVQRLFSCDRVHTSGGPRLWVQCRTVDVSTPAKEVLGVIPSKCLLYKVRSLSSHSSRTVPIPWMWNGSQTKSDVENRLSVQLQQIVFCNKSML